MRPFKFICTKLLWPLLRFFKINDPYRLLVILFLMSLAALPVFLDSPPISLQQIRYWVVGEGIAQGQLMYIQIYDATAPFAAALFGAFDWLFGRSIVAGEVMALVLLFFQAAFFAILLINNKAYNDNNYVPGLIFGILCFVSYDFLSLTPELFGSTLLLLALNNLFKEIEFRIQREETILSLGVYLGAASIFVFSYGVFLIGSLLILIMFTRISIRKALLLFFGFGLPHTILFLVYLRWEATDLLWQNFYQASFLASRQLLTSWSSLFYLFLIPLGYFIISLFMLTREARFTKYQTQLFQVMFLWLILAVVELFLARELTPHSLLTLLPSLTYFVSHYLLLIRRRWIAESMLWIFLAGVLLVSNLARTGVYSKVDYHSMIAHPPAYALRDKKVMMLAEHDGSVYLYNHLGGYFLSWPLSKKTIEQMDYYENVDRLVDALEKNPPDVIVDPENKWPTLLARVPHLQRTYTRKGTEYWRMASN